jgi:hypothetical protein
LASSAAFLRLMVDHLECPLNSPYLPNFPFDNDQWFATGW